MDEIKTDRVFMKIKNILLLRPDVKEFGRSSINAYVRQTKKSKQPKTNEYIHVLIFFFISSFVIRGRSSVSNISTTYNIAFHIITILMFERRYRYFIQSHGSHCVHQRWVRRLEVATKLFKQYTGLFVFVEYFIGSNVCLQMSG